MSRTIGILSKMQENSVFLNLTPEQKVDIIGCFHECYYNTSQDTEVFSKEYYYLTNEILGGRIPLDLEHLEDYEEYLFENLTVEQQQQYKESRKNRR